jgi:hypothetical protein
VTSVHIVWLCLFVEGFPLLSGQITAVPSRLVDHSRFCGAV